MKNKFFIVTTVPISLSFFKGQLRFLSQEFEICAISSQPENLVNFGKQEGVRTYCVPMRREISLWRDLISLFYLISFFVRERPKIVHGNTPKASLLSMLAAKLTGIPVRIYMCHGLRYQGCGGIIRKVLMCMERISCFCATNVIAVSQGVERTLVLDRICPKRKCKVIGFGSANGINLDLFNPEKISKLEIRKHLNIPNSAFMFLFVGRIVKDKGIDELVWAFNKLSQFRSDIFLILVGSEERSLNPISMHSREIIESSSNIYAVGQQFDVKPYMVSSNIFVLPSYREGFGMVLMEAGALNMPAITTDIIGCNEIIVQGENGIVIPSKNKLALYNAMKYAVENPCELQRMASNARSMIASRYEQKMVWNALLKEYQTILKAH